MSNPRTNAEAAVREGNLAAALSEIKQAIRSAPSDVDLRVFYFQLLCLDGKWEVASNQLVTIQGLSAQESTLPILYNNVLQGEILRSLVYRGVRQPTVFGEPPEWFALSIQAFKHQSAGEWAAAAALQSQALEQAPARSGTIDDEPFEWLADADSRFGPSFEILLQGSHYLVPQSAVESIDINEPTDLRDLVWANASMHLVNGTTLPIFLPVRYPGSENSENPLHKLARLTEWTEREPGFYTGLGQRQWSNGDKDFSLLQVRRIAFHG